VRQTTPSIEPRGLDGIVWRDEVKTILVTAGVIIQRKKVLVTQRKKDTVRGMFWEFPGGKVRDGEDPRKALQRELKEELDIEVQVGKPLEVVYHLYPEHPILLLAFHCRIRQGSPEPVGCRDLRWVCMDELKRLALTPADEPIRKGLLCSRK